MTSANPTLVRTVGPLKWVARGVTARLPVPGVVVTLTFQSRVVTVADATVTPPLVSATLYFVAFAAAVHVDENA